MRQAVVVALAAVLLAAGAATAGEEPGRALPDGKTSRGGYIGLIFNTHTMLVEGIDLEWGCRSVANGKAAFAIVTHKGIGRIPSSHKLSLDVALPYTKIGSSKTLGTARVTLVASIDWTPSTSNQHATAKGTVSVKTGPCSSGTLAFTAREH
ncbi:MAG TPA: hypothetical protein VJT84_06120 [Gaiellaceae bacterium]|nr:hypothetical protein [Gaiellaceae bacterium]